MPDVPTPGLAAFGTAERLYHIEVNRDCGWGPDWQVVWIYADSHEVQTDGALLLVRGDYTVGYIDAGNWRDLGWESVVHSEEAANGC